MKTKYFYWSFTGIFFLFVLSGCAPLVSNEQPMHTNWTTLNAGQLLGQTFTSSYAGLEGVALLIKHVEIVEGTVELTIYDYNLRNDPLAVSILPVSEIRKQGFQRLNFEPEKNSTRQDYYLELRLNGSGEILVGSAPGDSYLNGAAYIDGVAQDQQLTFRLIYERNIAFRGLILEGINWAFYLFIAVLLFVIPGWGILILAYRDWRSVYWPEKIGLSVGVSAAIYPVIILWTSLIGLQLGRLLAWLPISAGILVILWDIRNHREASAKKSRLEPGSLISSGLYLVVFALILFVRLWSIRELEAPMWGDGLQHTIISQLIVEQKGLFNSWAPYAELTSFTYHFGFHSLSAVFHWMTNLEMTQVVLWVGQLANIFSLLVLIPLANRLGGSRWAGVIAIATAGLLTSIPQIYLNWGRYTQLTGQVILPVFVLLVRDYLRKPPEQYKMLTLVVVVLSGLVLTHNRVSVFAAAFLVVYFLFNGFSKGFRQVTKSYLWIGLACCVLLLPWLVRILPSTVTELLISLLTKPASQLSETTKQAESILQFISYIPKSLWYISGVAIILGIIRRDKALYLMIIWWLLVLLAGYPQWLGLPGYGALGGFTVMIAAYIPVALLASYLFTQLIEYSKKTNNPPVYRGIVSGMVLITLLVLSLSFLTTRLKDINPQQSTLFTRADLRAAEWIVKNIPEDSLFLVNSFLAYDDTLVVGSDGGWWLTFKTNRSTTLQPINYVFENNLDPTYKQRILELTGAVQDLSISNPRTQTLVDDWGISHIYIGQQRGQVNFVGQSIEPEQILASGTFVPVYHEDRVWIFERVIP